MPKNFISKRSTTRLIAVQSLYQYDFYDHKIAIDDLSDILLANYFLTEDQECAEDYSDKIDGEFLLHLTANASFILDKIDDLVAKFLKSGYQIQDLADILLNILRLAVFEIKFGNGTTPEKALISEYVDLAACFYDSKKVAFVNKFLQRIVNEL